jgi:hypothetical protein
MAREIDELTQTLFEASIKADPSACSCGLGAREWPLSSHREDCTLNLLWASCRDEAKNQLYGGAGTEDKAWAARAIALDLFQATAEKDGIKCSCGLHENKDIVTKIMGEHKQDCALVIAWDKCFKEAVNHAPDPPEDEKGLLKAIERCQDWPMLKATAKQYCRDRWKALKEKGAAVLEEARLTELYAKAILDLKKARAQRRKYKESLFRVVGERDAKKAILDDVACDRRRITLQLGDAVIELERLKERYLFVYLHREDVIEVAKEARRYLINIKRNQDLLCRLSLAITNNGKGSGDITTRTDSCTMVSTQKEETPNDPA